MKKIILLPTLLIFICSFGQTFNDNSKSETKDSEISMSEIETVPLYPGCKNRSNSENRKCISNKISEFVMWNFNTDIAKNLGLSGNQRIAVIFKIDTKGKVRDIRIRAPHPKLEKEAIRVINMLPRMEPGTKNGKPVIVPYSLPITFQVSRESTPRSRSDKF